MRSLTKTSFSLALLSSLVLTGCGSSSSNPSASSASPSNNVSAGAAQDQSQPSAAVSSSKPDSGCLAGGPDVAKGETKGMKWEINPEGGRNLFSIEGAGPCSVGPGGLRTGYAHTAAGALAAALNYDAQLSTSFPEKNTPTRLKAALATGSDSEALIKSAEEKVASGDLSDSSMKAVEDSIKVKRYQVVSFNENEARIRVEILIPSKSEPGVGTLDLKWENNDWKIVPSSNERIAEGSMGTGGDGMTALPQN